jgi:non-specific serine/threonine protein kinase
MVGDELAGYRLQGVLGRGGMSVVYEAENPRLGSSVALKVLAPELATNDAFRTRFLKESRVAASLNHPNVIPIYDMGSHEDLLFIAMRYVSGADLRAVLKTHPVLAPDQALALISQAGRALDAAHRHGLVHRDVKPGNILIEHGSDDDDDDEPDHVYLTDFGISKHAASRSGLTATGEFMGTIDYIAPEQIRSQPTDGRADIYSLGCVLYECLTGRVPFAKDIDAAVIWAHVEEMPTLPSSLQPSLPPGIDQVMAKVLAKDPAGRYGTCREFVHATRAALLGAASAAPRAATVLAASPAVAEPASPAPAESPGPAPAEPTSLAAADPIAPAAASSRDATTPIATPGRHVIPATAAGHAPPRQSADGGSAPPVPPSPARERPPAGPPPADPPPSAQPGRRRLLAGLSAVALVIAAVGGFLIWHSTSGSSPTPGASTPVSSTPTQAAADSWQLGHNSPFSVQQLPAAVLDGRIWTAGGLLGEDQATNKTEYYDPTVRTWGLGPALPFKVHHAMMVTYHDQLWLIGGFLPQGTNMEASASAHVLILDRAKGRWVEGPALHHPRAAGAAAVVGGKIVVVGGRTGGRSEQVVSQTEVYDGKTWTDAAAIPVPGDHVAATTDGTYLYAVGGRRLTPSANTKAVQRFDPATGQWTQLPPLPTADSDLGAAIIGGQLITFGGENLFTVFGTVRAYNLATKTWSTLPSLAQPRHGMGVAVIRNTLYAIDGASEPGHHGSSHIMQTFAVPGAAPVLKVARNWWLARNSPFSVQQLPAAVLDGRIWTAGGLLGEDQATNKTEYYDPTVRTWGLGPALPFKVHHAMMVTYHDQLWLIGGFLPQGTNMEASASAHVLILDRAKGRWVEGPALHHPRAAGAAAVVGGKIVVVGGRTGGRSEQVVSQTEVYDGKTWTDAAAIPVPGDHVAATTDGTYLYAVGGRRLTPSANTKAVQRFDPATGQWTQLPPLPTADSDLGAAIIGGQLITFGGENLFTVFGTVRAYNLATKTWSTLPSLAQPRHGMGVAVIRNTLYAIDGASEPGHHGSSHIMQAIRFHR